MSESEPQQIIPRPEDILSPQEAQLLQQADRGELTCPCCGHGLVAEKVITAVYEGVFLFCPDMASCGYREY